MSVSHKQSKGKDMSDEKKSWDTANRIEAGNSGNGWRLNVGYGGGKIIDLGKAVEGILALLRSSISCLKLYYCKS